MQAAVDQLLGISLYALTFALELLSAALRFWVTALVLSACLWILWPALAAAVFPAALIAAAAPAVGSLAAVCGVPGGAGLKATRLMARRPSARELESIEAALQTLGGLSERPRRVLVLDDPRQHAFSVGTSLYVNRGLIDDPALAAALAHELGHLNSLDARLRLALDRLGPTIARKLPVGGIGVRLTRALWNVWWRRREFAADRYAQALGHGDELAELLHRELLLDATRPKDHPHTELRIERLRAEHKPASASGRATGSRTLH